MRRPSIRDLERRVEDLKAGGLAADVASEISVEWREADPENRPEGMSWNSGTGTLAYDAWDAQRRALSALEASALSEERELGDEHDLDPDLVAFLAGYGAGKSITGARWLITQAIEYPGSRFLALGTDFTKARDTTFRVLFENLPGERTHVVTSSFNGPESSPLVADYNRAEHRLTLVNDTVIKLGSADQWNRYAGDEYGGIWKDEPSHYGEDLHDLLEMMGSRLRGVDGPKKMFWTLTGNGYNAAWEILEEQRDKTGDPIGLNIELIRASTLENPYLDDADKERFGRQYGGTGREEQALHGGFAAAQGLVYDQFRRDVHVIPHSEAVERVDDSNEWRVYGYDAGWNDPRVLLEAGRTAYNQLVVLDEYHEHRSHVEDVIEWLRENDKPEGTIFAEHVPAEIKKLRQSGLTVEKADKDLDSGLSEVRRRLRDDGNATISEPASGKPSPVYRSRPGGTRDRRVIRRSPSGAGEDENDSECEPQVGLLISDRCEHLIRELLGYKEEHVGASQAVDHCADSLRYLCMGVAGGSETRKKQAGPIRF